MTSAHAQIHSPQHKTWILTDLETKRLYIVIFFDIVYRKRDDVATLRICYGLIGPVAERVTI